ncbi:MAG: hypothetical protein ABEJ28_04915 [Salinigranum sp.]
MSERGTRETMADVSHTHPHTGETFGDAFRRGPTIAADGGAPGDSPDTMADVSHTPPHGVGANEVWSRGAAETVEDAGADVPEDVPADE